MGENWEDGRFCRGLRIFLASFKPVKQETSNISIPKFWFSCFRKNNHIPFWGDVSYLTTFVCILINPWDWTFLIFPYNIYDITFVMNITVTVKVALYLMESLKMFFEICFIFLIFGKGLTCRHRFFYPRTKTYNFLW